MTVGEINLNLRFIKGNPLDFLPPPRLGPDAYTRLIVAAWHSRTEEDRQRYLMDKRNRPVAAWFHLDGWKKDK